MRDEAEAIAALAAELRLWTVFGSLHPLTPRRGIEGRLPRSSFAPYKGLKCRVPCRTATRPEPGRNLAGTGARQSGRPGSAAGFTGKHFTTGK